MSEFNNSHQQQRSQSDLNPEIHNTMFSLPEHETFLDDTIDELIDYLEEREQENQPTSQSTGNLVNVYDFHQKQETDTIINNLVVENQQQSKDTIETLEMAVIKNQANVPQEDYHHLLAQLELSSQTIQSQQVMIETLSNQLEETQAQLSNLERECSQIQDNYNQQTYKLLETEKQLQELHSRLLRQQRYTLEYKTALEECFKDTTAMIVSANNSLAKHQSVEARANSNNNVTSPKKTTVVEAQIENIKVQKSDWPSPGIESQTFQSQKKVKKLIDLPKFPR